MKNIYKPFSQILLVLGILLFTATACSSDDKKATPTENLQGLWRLTEIKHVPIMVAATDGTEGTTSEEETDEAEAEDPSTIYPTVNGEQPYIRFGAATYDFFKVTPTDTTLQETGNYSAVSKEIITEPVGRSAIAYGYEISGKQLIMIEINGADEIYYYAEKVTGDPFLPEETSENEEPENPDGEELTGCAVNHDMENSPLGSSLNPILINTGVEILDSLYANEGKNGHEAKFYLQVEPFTAFRIHVRNIMTNYDDVHNFFKYTTIDVTDAFSTDQSLYTNKMEAGQTTLEFDLFATTTCLYIEFFSYQKGVKLLFEVEDLSGSTD